MATHSSILAWRIPWQRNLVGYSPWDRKESGTSEGLTLSLFTVNQSLTKNVHKGGGEPGEKETV